MHYRFSLLRNPTVTSIVFAARRNPISFIQKHLADLYIPPARLPTFDLLATIFANNKTMMEEEKMTKIIREATSGPSARMYAREVFVIEVILFAGTINCNSHPRKKPFNPPQRGRICCQGTAAEVATCRAAERLEDDVVL